MVLRPKVLGRRACQFVILAGAKPSSKTGTRVHFYCRPSSNGYSEPGFGVIPKHHLAMHGRLHPVNIHAVIGSQVTLDQLAHGASFRKFGATGATAQSLRHPGHPAEPQPHPAAPVDAPGRPRYRVRPKPVQRRPHGPMAQRLERGTHNPLVRGSNPRGHTNLVSPCFRIVCGGRNKRCENLRSAVWPSELARLPV